MISLKGLQVYRGTRIFLLTALILVFSCLCFPAMASAVTLTLPPTPYPTFTPMAVPSYAAQQLPAFSSTASVPSTFSAAIDLAHIIYRDLFVFELIMIGITMGLFRDDLVGLFSATTMKVLSAGFFLQIMMVPNATDGQPLAYKVAASVINGFQNSGVAPVTNTGPIADKLYGAAAGLFTSAGIRELGDEAQVAAGAGTTASAVGNSFYGIFWFAQYNAIRDETFDTFSEALATGIMLAGATIQLQETLLQYEVDIVLTVGIILLGFTACRWTAGFADNYHKYTISVGVKYIVFYLMLPLIQQMVDKVIIGSVLSFVPNSAALLGLAIAAVYSLTASVLLAVIPGFAASLMSGQSGVSAMSAIQSSGVISALTTAFNQGKYAKHDAKAEQEKIRDQAQKAAQESLPPTRKHHDELPPPVPSPLKGSASKKAKGQQKET